MRLITKPGSVQSWPWPSQDPEASTLASARVFPGACETQPGPPQAGAARAATEAAARSRSSPGPDDRRSWGRPPRTCRCSRARYGRPRCGPAGSAGPPRCRDRAGQRAGGPRPRQPRCAAIGHGDRGDAVRRQRPDRQPVRYPSQSQKRQDCSLNSPPGSRSCHYRGLEQRRCYHQTVTRGQRKDMSSRAHDAWSRGSAGVLPEPAVGVPVPPGTRRARMRRPGRIQPADVSGPTRQRRRMRSKYLSPCVQHRYQGAASRTAARWPRPGGSSPRRPSAPAATAQRPRSRFPARNSGTS